MKTLHFKDYDEMACAVADKLDEIIDEDTFNDISIIAKYEEARQIIKELICIGYDIKSVDIHDVEWDGYDDPYIISVANIDGAREVWCEPFLRESGYINDESKVIYIFDNCSSNVISHCNGETMYEVSVGEEPESDCYKLDEKSTCSVKSDDDGYTISVKCNLDADEAEKIIQDMERRIERMNNMFKEMDNFRRLFRW